jgi:hypothetical protein
VLSTSFYLPTHIALKQVLTFLGAVRSIPFFRLYNGQAFLQEAQPYAPNNEEKGKVLLLSSP